MIDTNVLISKVFWPGKPKQLLNKVRDGSAERIITGDLELLGLRSFQGIRISTVADFFSQGSPST